MVDGSIAEPRVLAAPHRLRAMAVPARLTARRAAAQHSLATLEFADRVRQRLYRAIVGLAVIAGATVVVFRTSVLPARFNLDSMQIQRIASGQLSSLGDNSFGNVAAIYRFFGLQHLPIVAGMAGYAAALVVIGLALRSAKWRLNSISTASCVAAVLMSAIYLGTYAKDVFVLPVIALIICFRRGIVGDLVVLGAILLYADMMRTYWFMIAALFIAYAVLIRIIPRKWVLIVVPPVVIVLLAFGMPALTGHAIDFARTYVNDARGPQNASTVIRPIVSLPQPFGGLVNTEFVLLTIVIPIPLLLRAAPYYFASAAIFLLLWASLLFGAARVHVASRVTRSMVFIAAFVTTQAIFEPDYGSVLRHLTPLLPLVVLIALGRCGSAVGGAEKSWPRLGRAHAARQSLSV